MMSPERWHPAMPKSTRAALQDMIDRDFNIEVGDYTYGVPAVRWAEPQRQYFRLKIGKYCSFAADIEIYVGRQGRHTVDFLSTYPIGLIHGPMPPGDKSEAHTGDLGVTIGNDVWVGRGAQIMAGVSIGDGAVIGARSLVTNHVPPYAIAVGTPAKPLRHRFPPDIVEALLEIEWWNFDGETLSENITLFNKADMYAVVERLRELKAAQQQ